MMRRSLGWVVCTGFVVSLVGSALADDTATVKGKVTFEGEGKPRKNIKKSMEADATCSKLHENDKQVGSEDFIRDKESGGLQNVIVFVKEGLGDKKYPAPATKASIDQHGCIYTPHIVTLQVGQTMEIKNSDNTTHNIHSASEKNPPFNFAQTAPGQVREETFKFPEVFPVKCDVHPWMAAWVGVFDHPFYAVTAKDGTYEIKGLPAGKYTIVAWHELYGEAATTEVTVTGGQTAESNMVIKDAK